MTKQIVARKQLSTLARGLDILEYVARNPLGVTNSNVSTHFKIDKSSAYRFLNTLLAKNYLWKENNTYELSYHLLSLQEQHWIKQKLVAPYIKALSYETGFSCSFSVLKGFYGIPIVIEKGRAPVIVNSNLGKEVALYASALGKVLLSYSGDAFVENFLSSIHLKSFTYKTIVDKNTLCREAKKITSLGYAIDDEEYEEGVRCIAVPLFDKHGSLVGAVSCASPADRFPKAVKRMEELLEKVKECSKKITKAL